MGLYAFFSNEKQAKIKGCLYKSNKIEGSISTKKKEEMQKAQARRT